MTCAGPGAEGPGRTLVYCPKCRVVHQHDLDASFPLNLVAAETLLGLYATRRWSGRVIDRVPGSYAGARAAQLNRQPA